MIQACEYALAHMDVPSEKNTELLSVKSRSLPGSTYIFWLFSAFLSYHVSYFFLDKILSCLEQMQSKLALPALDALAEEYF